MLNDIRNLIECNRSLSLFYDSICQNRIYRSLINKKVEKRILYLAKNKKYKFMIETASICNAKCSFCIYQSSSRAKIIMSDDTFNLIVKRIKDEKITPTIFDLFLLGEPLIDPNLFKRITTLKNNFPESSVRITSNFALASPEIIEQIFSSGLDGINISLNAASSDSYKKIMGIDYDTTVQNINALIDMKNKKQSRLEIQISFVLCKENYKESNKFRRLWKYKVNSLRFQRMHEWSGRKLIGSDSKYSTNKYLYPCNDLFERIPILSNGDYSLCCADSTGLTDININATPILDAFSSSAYNNLRQIHLNGKINNCSMCNKCMGVNSNGANWLFAPGER